MFFFLCYHSTVQFVFIITIQHFTHPASVKSHFLAITASWLDLLSCHMSHVLCFYQVVVKTKADYIESKKGKLRSPKIAEFSISIIEGVSERLKVRNASSHFPCFSHSTHAHVLRADRRHNSPSPIHVILLCSDNLSVLRPVQPVLHTGRHNAQWFT